MEFCRPSLKQDIRPSSAGLTSASNSAGGGSTSFQDFQESVDDAWDSGDDEFCTVSDVRISKKVSKSAALSVIDSHRLSAKKELKDDASCEDKLSEENKSEALQRLAAQPLQMKNANAEVVPSQVNHRCDEVEVKHKMRNAQFPGRPQPLRQSNSAKCFVSSKEQGSDFIFVFSFKVVV